MLNEQIKCFQFAYRLPTDYPCTVIAMGLSTVYGRDWGKVKSIVEFLANVNSSSCSLYVIDGPSVVCRLKSSQSLIRMSIAHVYKSKNRHRIKKMNKTMIVTNTVINYKLTVCNVGAPYSGD